MQIISGSVGKWKVHFEAPPSDRVPGEMAAFIDWFNTTAPSAEHEIKNPVIGATIAHLYFACVHTFEDGNGRIGRAISEKALSQGLGRPTLLILSETIEANKKDYYEDLKTAQQSNKITPWIEYFANITLQSQTRAEENIDFVLKKTKFFDRFKGQLNERQLKVIRRMLDKGPQGFEGGMTAKK